LHCYQLYGLTLRTDWALPLAPAISSGGSLAEIELRVAPASTFAPFEARVLSRPSPDRWLHLLKLEDGSRYLRWRGLFEFLVSPDGKRIAGRPLQRSNPEAFQAYLLGHVLSCAMVCQGLEPLHATVVVINGGAVGFLGDTGYGKSSAAVAFLQAGYRLLTDDLLMVSRGDAGWMAHPGPPRIKLYPEMARLLFSEPLPGAPMTDETTKRVLPLSAAQSQSSPVPLRKLYVLSPPRSRGTRAGIRIQKAKPGKAFFDMLRNTFNVSIVEPARLRQQFEHFRQLATSISVSALHYPREVSALDRLRETILRDLSR
jgi:hypothetical protein